MTRAQEKRSGRPRCDRSWEIEAAHDGRLSGAALGALGGHIEQCRECREQSEYIEGLGRALREQAPVDVDDVAVRRLRQRTLARVDAELSGRSHRPFRTRLAFATGAVAFAALALVAVLVWQRPRPVAVVPTTTVDAVDEGGARWSRRTEGDIDRVELNDGTLRLRVQKTAGGKRLVVRVPDGEIEDIGTVFHVVVSRGHTQRVGVDEGRVTIRLEGATPITISSGQTWERPQEPAPTPIQPALPTSASAPAAQPAASKRSPAPASSDRREAASALPVAPADAAKEDAAYLRAIQLQREGREAEAKAAASEYLRRFPDGFRREEMGRIAK